MLLKVLIKKVSERLTSRFLWIQLNKEGITNNKL